MMWTEKYRPDTLDEVINQSNTVETINHFLGNPGAMPHLLFSGPPGTGKTTVALCIARNLFGGRWRDFTLELNASDERGINMVRERIKSFSRHATGLLGNVPFGLIILDESDQMTSQAQTALRRIMETGSRTSRFILICNYASKIIEPIQSRCAIFRFSYLKSNDMKSYLQMIAESEELSLVNEGIDAIIEFSEGDMRKAINILQSASVLKGVIDLEIVLNVVGMAKPVEVREMVISALKGDFLKSRDILYDLMIKRGISGVDIIRQVHSEIFHLDLPDTLLMDLANTVAEYDFRIVEGANEDIQLSALLAQFWKKGSRLGA